jgi:tetratricopeptide (TPR) repeat protein
MFAGGPLRQKGRIAAALAAVWVSIFAWASWNRVQTYSSAENIYKEALELYPGDARNLNNLATLQIHERRFDDALANLQATLNVDPNHVEALANLGAIYQMPEAGRVDLNKAESFYLRALRIDPSHANSWQNLGFLKIAQGRPDAAKVNFERALELSPRSAALLVGLGRAEQLLGNFPAAIQRLEAALKEEPGHPVALKALSGLKQ